MRILCLGVVVTALACCPVAARGQEYSNEQYRFSARVPAGLTECPHIPPGSDHGYLVPLSGQSCAWPFDAEFLAVVGSYNVTESSDPRRVARWRCGRAPVRQVRANADLQFYHCRRRTGREWVEIHYIALRLHQDWVFGVEYTATLRCRPENCTRYESRLREAVASLRFH